MLTSTGCQVMANLKAPRWAAQRQQIVRRMCAGRTGSAAGAVPGRSSGSA